MHVSILDYVSAIVFDLFEHMYYVDYRLYMSMSIFVDQIHFWVVDTFEVADKK